MHSDEYSFPGSALAKDLGTASTALVFFFFNYYPLLLHLIEVINGFP